MVKISLRSQLTAAAEEPDTGSVARRAVITAKRDAALLANAGAVLASAEDEPTILRRLAELLVPATADACVFDLVPAGHSDQHETPKLMTGTLHRALVHAADPALARFAQQFSQYQVDLADPNNLVSRVVRTCRSDLTPKLLDSHLTTTARGPEHLALLRALNIHSHVIVPLMARGRCLGAITLVGSTDRRAYDLEDLALAEGLAQQAAIGIDKLRAYAAERLARRAAEHSAARITRLHRVTTALSEAITPSRIVEVIVEQGLAALNATQGFVAVHASIARTLAPTPDLSAHDDHDDDALIIMTSTGYPTARVDPWRRIPLKASVPVTESVRRGELVWVPAGTDWRARYPALNLDQPTLPNAVVAVPLIADGRVMGALGFSLDPRVAFDDDDHDFTLALARHCAQALERARLYRAVELELAERTRAEAALRASEETNRALLSAVPDILFRISRDGVFRAYRAANEQLYSPPPLFLNRHISEVMPPDVAERTMRYIAKALEDHDLQTFEYHLTGPMGAGDFEARIAVSGDDEVLAIVRDVSERKRAERTLRFLAEANASLATSLDVDTTLRTVASLVVPFFADWCIVDALDANGTPRRVTVVPPDPSLADVADALARFAPDQRRSTGAGWVLASGQPELITRLSPTFIVDAARDDDHIAVMKSLDAQSYLSVPLIARGRILGAISCLITNSSRRYDENDLTVAVDLARRAALAVDNARLFQEQVVAREKVQQLAAERTRVLGQIADGVIITNALGEIVFINEAAHRLHGGVEIAASLDDYVRLYQPKAADGRPLSSHDLPIFRALQRQVTIHNEEWRVCRPDGTEVTVIGGAAPVITDDDTVFGVVLTLHDVTVQREFERHKDQFIASISHDLKTPLTSIKGWAQLLRQRGEQDDSRASDQRALAAINDQARTMQRLIDRLLDASRFQLERAQELHRQNLDLHRLLTRLIELHQGLTERHQLELESVGPGIAIGCLDPDVVSQILDNLLSNAIKYSPKGGNIRLRLVVEADDIQIMVGDAGIGIPSASLPRVFDQFYRAPNAVSLADGELVEGLGLGLFSARHLTERMGGRLEVTSEERVGSTFTLTFPLGHCEDGPNTR